MSDGFFTAPIRRPPYSIALVVLAANQDFAFAGVVRLTDNAFLLHSLDQRCGAVEFCMGFVEAVKLFQQIAARALGSRW